MQHACHSIADCVLCPLVQLAAPADIYVNDAFGCAHRAHASTAGVANFLKPAVAGILMKKVRTACFTRSACSHMCPECEALGI